MALKTRYLQELSDLFVQDLKRSQYYRKLPENERRDLDDQIAEEALQGQYPLLPAADADYRLVVAKDWRADLDPETHTCLLDKIFPRQATVVSATDFLEVV